MNGSEMVLRIAKWSKVYERADTRKVKSVTWVAMPIGFSSNGYQSMLDEFGDQAPAIYGAWCALVAFAASCTVRGLLANSQGKPIKLGHIARITGFPSSVFDDLVRWASSEDVRWLESISAEDASLEIAKNVEDSQHPADLPAPREIGGKTSRQSPGTPGDQRDYKTRQDKTEQDVSLSSDCLSSVVIDEVDLEEVKTGAIAIRDRYDKFFDRDEAYKLAWIGTVADPGCVQMIVRDMSNNRQIAKPSKYLVGAIRKRCQEKGFSYDDLRKRAPKPPAPPGTLKTIPPPEKALSALELVEKLAEKYCDTA